MVVAIEIGYMYLPASAASICVSEKRLKSVKYNRNQNIIDSPEKIAINSFSLLKENNTNGNAIANININSTLPAFPTCDAVNVTLKLKVIIKIKRASVRLPFLEMMAESIKNGAVAPI